MKLAKKIKKANKCLQTLIKKNLSNYQNFFEQMKKIFILCAIILACVTIQSCNVTRKVTTEASFFQKGDTTTTITTKTVETYDAKKYVQ